MTIGSPFDLLVIDVHDDCRSSGMIDEIKEIDQTIKILIIDENHAESETDSYDRNIIVTRPQKIASFTDH